MKLLRYAGMLCIFLSAATLVSAQNYNISPFFGERLDREARNFYGLFPDCAHFDHALFQLNPDSSLGIRMRFDNGMPDSLIRSYSSLSSIRQHLMSVEMQERVTQNIKNGRNISVYLGARQILTGEFISVRPDGIIIKLSHQVYEDSDDRSYRFLPTNAIQILRLNGTSRRGHILESSAWGVAIGAVGGALSKDIFQTKFDQYPQDAQKKLFASSLIGAATGGLIGFMHGWFTDFDREIEVFPAHYELRYLLPYVKYQPGDEPEYIRKIH